METPHARPRGDAGKVIEEMLEQKPQRVVLRGIGPRARALNYVYKLLFLKNKQFSNCSKAQRKSPRHSTNSHCGNALPRSAASVRQTCAAVAVLPVAAPP